MPIRNRTEHLTAFVRYMHPFLQRQQLSYIIIAVEQSGKCDVIKIIEKNVYNLFPIDCGAERSPFNRGMLMNIGFNEGQLLKENYQCFIFHDVDTLPEDDSNPYTCPEDGKPRQMSFSIDYWNNYK